MCFRWLLKFRVYNSTLVLKFNIFRYGLSLDPEIQSLEKSFGFELQCFCRYGFWLAPEIQSLKKSFDYGIQYFSVRVFGGSRNPEPKKQL